jgi:uncharacterized protein involved in outer membrane biogenesis
VKIFKRLALTIAILIVILIIGVFIFLKLFLTPENIKPLLTKQMEQLTGYELTINGDLSWKIFPNLTVTTNDLSLTSPNEDQVQITEFNFCLKLLPLLRKQIELTHINIDDVSYKTSQGETIKLDKFSINAKHFVLDQTFPLAFSGIMTNGESSPIDFSATTQATISQDEGSVNMNELNIKINDATVTGDFTFQHDPSAIPNPQALVPSNLSFRGNFNIDKWQAGQLQLSQVATSISLDNSIITLDPIKADFYQGTFSGNALINMQQQVPNYTIDAKLTNTQIDGIIDDLSGKQYFSGKANISAKLQSKGLDQTEFLQNLNGKTSMTVQDGKLISLDFGKDISNVLAMAQSKKSETFDAFDQLKINSNIKQGKAKINAKLTAPNYKASGKGNVNLVQQTINLSLEAYYTQSKQTRNIAIPITIAGPLENPTVTVSTDEIITQALGSKGNGQLNNLISGFFS